MLINKVIIGNNDEAFIESNFTNGVNIISSDDNNKGKTIVIQSLMYALGNTPAFPASFNYKEYYHIVEFVINHATYLICRKKDSFVLHYKDSLMVFDNVSELKRYWSKNIFELPTIIKNGTIRIVDPELFVQLCFVGQDKKDTSNIVNNSFYNKEDFVNMLLAYCKISSATFSDDEIDEIKQKIKRLKSEREDLLKQNKILKSAKKAVSLISVTNDRESFEIKLKEIEKIKTQIIALQSERNIATGRKTKNELVLRDLRSLNRTIGTGTLKCLDCGSVHVGFETTAEYSFDVSTTEIRSQIIDSINDKVESYEEEIERLTIEINSYQKKLQELLKAEDISLESLLSIKDSALASADSDDRISEINKELSKLNSILKINNSKDSEAEAKKKELLAAIIDKMNTVYKTIDPEGALCFYDLFYKRDKVISGSEATIYHLSKLYALAQIVSHPMPIVVDSFRAEDLSTEKERRVLDLYNSLGLQVIFTTTLKEEEFGKYNSFTDINHMDYSGHMASKLLSVSYKANFDNYIKKLAINI